MRRREGEREKGGKEGGTSYYREIGKPREPKREERKRKSIEEEGRRGDGGGMRRVEVLEEERG